MSRGLSKNFGLIGTITYDVITYESGPTFEGIGGVLFQAAVLCGLRKDVYLYTNLGQELVHDVEGIIKSWSNFHRKGIKPVPGPGNRVHLCYPQQGERIEVLKSVVPPLNPAQILKDLPELGMLILVINSGFDLELEDWRKITQALSCPLWLDIHSLPLARKIGVNREYISLTEWKEWAEGVDYLQANKQEVASMLGCPQRLPLEAEIKRFAEKAFDIGVKVVFITLGKEGGIVLTPEGSKKITSPPAKSIVDTTGCGDVFCGATAASLAEGKDPFAAAFFGLELAAKAASLSGIRDTYALAQRAGSFGWFPESNSP